MNESGPFAGKVNRWGFRCKAVDGFANERREGIDQKGDEGDEDNQKKDDTLPRPIGGGSIIDISVFAVPFVVHGLLYSQFLLFLLSLKSAPKGNIDHKSIG